jgi:hypothetical protein
MIEKNSLKFKELDHVKIEKTGQLFKGHAPPGKASFPSLRGRPSIAALNRRAQEKAWSPVIARPRMSA